MGTKLGEKIAREWENLDIDVVIRSGDLLRHRAGNRRILDKPYRQGFVKNRYVSRTFIMPGQQLRRKSVRRNQRQPCGIRDKNVLLVDDSIVRGTTSGRSLRWRVKRGRKKYLASAAPEFVSRTCTVSICRPPTN